MSYNRQKRKIFDWITPDGLLTLTGYARDGLSDKQIADNIGITKSTFYKWKNDFKELQKARKKYNK